MRRAFCLALSIYAVWVSQRACAADSSDARALANTIAPYVEAETIVVAHVDLARVDVDAAMAEAAKVWRFAEDNREPPATTLQARAAALRERLLAAGASELFLAATLEDALRREPYVIVPVSEQGNPDEVARLLFSGSQTGPTSRAEARRLGVAVSGPFQTCQPIGRVVFCGTDATLQRLRGAQPALRPELAEGFRAAGNTPVQMIFMLPADSRRVLAEMMPELPEEFGRVSGKELADAFQWAAVAIDLPPRPFLRLIVQSSSEQSAQSMHGLIINFYRQLAQVAELRRHVPTVDGLLQLVTPIVQGDRLVLELTEENRGVPSLRDLIGRPIDVARLATSRSQRINRLRQLIIALTNFESAYGSFPPAASYDESGKALLSWRVFVLPFLDERDLYEEFHLDEPWDSEHNKKLISKMPAAFAPASDVGKRGTTTYLAPRGKGTMFEGVAGVHVSDVPDGVSKTIMLVEVDPRYAVIWTKPDDLEVDLDNPLIGLLGDRDEFLAGYTDARVSVISKDIPAERLRRLLIRNDHKNPEEGD